MSYIIIGDVHGTSYWKDIVKKYKKTDRDVVVFLGDYVDSYTINPKNIYQNLLDLFKYKKNTPNVFMLVGNHDYHYMKYDIDRYSGYNHQYAEKYYDIFMQNYDLMDITYQLDISFPKTICSHAGISNTFLKKYDITVEDINKIWKEDPSIFGFDYNTPDIYGNSSSQGPLWIRPQALFNNMIEEYSQIVGHTNVNKPYTKYPDPFSGNSVTIVCTEDENGFIVYE